MSGKQIAILAAVVVAVALAIWSLSANLGEPPRPGADQAAAWKAKQEALWKGKEGSSGGMSGGIGSTPGSAPTGASGGPPPGVMGGPSGGAPPSGN